MKPAGKTNRLINEKSPYLLQHAYNPVDWYPWGEEAFEAARSKDLPIFLSIGYSTCHWCHNMARDSFEDDKLAWILNEHFISIKVDREERPDVDQLYMNVCQMFTGQGGWPLTVIMTPDKIPFFAGTFFPREPRYNMPGLKNILKEVAQLWERDRKSLEEKGREVLGSLKKQQAGRAEGVVREGTLQQAAEGLKKIFDRTHGGFGRAPKFPMPHSLTFLLRMWKRSGEEDYLNMVKHTLESMERGGIFDHLGYGFHRYSVDEKWLVPHFEKMLYDQALLAGAYVEAYQATGIESFADTAHKIFTYVLGEMQDQNGGFYSAENAESEGVEGKYYLWEKQELLEALGEERGELLCSYWGVTGKGNFEEGKNILHLPRRRDAFLEEQGIDQREWFFLLEESRKMLLDKRLQRVRPSLDDKILTSWNGLMIGALAKGAGALKGEIYARAAAKAAEFILREMEKEEGTLLHCYRGGEAAIKGFAEDYAYFVSGLLDLYEALPEPLYLEKALSLTEKMLDLFRDKEEGGLSQSRSDSGDLPLQVREAFDGALPSPNSVAAQNLLRLASITSDENLETKALELIESFGSFLKQSPAGFTAMLSAADFALGPVQEIVVAGERDDPVTEKMLSAVYERFLPRKVFLSFGEDNFERLQRTSPHIQDKKPLQDSATAYLCRNFSCLQPLTDPEEWGKLLDREAAV